MTSIRKHNTYSHKNTSTHAHKHAYMCMHEHEITPEYDTPASYRNCKHIFTQTCKHTHAPQTRAHTEIANIFLHKHANTHTQTHTSTHVAFVGEVRKVIDFQTTWKVQGGLDNFSWAAVSLSSGGFVVFITSLTITTNTRSLRVQCARLAWVWSE